MSNAMIFKEDLKDLYLDTKPVEGFKGCEAELDIATAANMLDAISRIVPQTFFIGDCINKSLVKISGETMPRLLGKTSIEVNTGNSGVFDCVPERDFRIIRNAVKGANSIINSLSVTERCNIVMSLDFPFISEGKTHMINCHIKPLCADSVGRIRLIIGAMSLSSQSERTAAFLKTGSNDKFYEFSICGQRWKEADFSHYVLSDNEYEVLAYSIRGMPEKIIAEKMSKSVDTIKTYKRSIFYKFNSFNIIEAVAFAHNHKLL